MLIQRSKEVEINLLPQVQLELLFKDDDPGRGLCRGLWRQGFPHLLSPALPQLSRQRHATSRQLRAFWLSLARYPFPASSQSPCRAEAGRWG